MPFEYFQNAFDNGMAYAQPNSMYRDLEQAFINQQWDNTTAIITVQEQQSIGSTEYNEMEVWISSVVGTTSTGAKDGYDFQTLIFRDINHTPVRGLYYQFDHNYWLTYFNNKFDSVSEAVSVRRCNNQLRMIDPANGSVFTCPCVVDYDMASPSIQVSRNIITPNNHAVIMVQGNADTFRLFTINTRFILGGRPFKLYAYQNTLNSGEPPYQPTLLYLDLYLDELHAEDNLELQLADNGVYAYTVDMVSEDMQLTQGSVGVLEAKVLLNGQEVDRNLVWTSDNEEVVSLVDNTYVVNGEVGEKAVITATLMGNSLVYATVTIEVSNNIGVSSEVIIEPAFSKIREYETIDFAVQLAYGGSVITNPSSTTVSLAANEEVLENEYLSITQTSNNSYAVNCLKRSQTGATLYVRATSDTHNIDEQTAIDIDLVSMFG